LRLIRRLNDALGLTSVVVTHDVQEAMSIADRVVVLAGGRIIGSGTPDEVISQKATEPALAQFLDGLAEGPLTGEAETASLGEELGLGGRS